MKLKTIAIVSKSEAHKISLKTLCTMQERDIICIHQTNDTRMFQKFH